jgi:PAS domain S-box-containing protein
MPDREPVPILVVDDRTEDLEALRAALEPLGETVVAAGSAKHALRLVETVEPAVAILDIRMPEVDGFALAEQLRTSPATRHVPILFVSAADPTPELLTRVHALGAVDFLARPVNPLALRAKVAVFVQLYRSNRALTRKAHQATTDARARASAQEERLRLLLDAASDYALFFADAEGVISEWPASAQQLFGFPATEALGRHAALIFTPEDQAAGVPILEMEHAILNGQAPDERWHVRRDGRRFFAVGRLVALRRTDGTISGFAKIVRDATQQVLANQELAESRRQLHLAIEAAELGTFFHDMTHNRIVHSERACRLLGLRPGAEITSEEFLAQVHPDDRAHVAATLAARRDSAGRQGDLKLEYRVRWPDGSIHHLASASHAVVDESANGSVVVSIVGTLRDVTAAKEFELELKNKVAERTAALMEKTAQLESFSYTVAHDLRSPLRAISGYADIVVQDFGAALPPGAVDYLNRIKSSAERLDLLINDLLAYSRLTQVEIILDEVSLQSSVDWAVQHLHPEIAAKSAQVEVVTPLPRVWAERGVLDQIFLNLLSNALKFVPADRPPRVEVCALTSGDLVRCEVRDNGIGIPPAYHARIFRVFERLQPAREFPGTGVGLAIVAKAAERLGATVGVKSAPDRGSTFWIELRRAGA